MYHLLEILICLRGTLDHSQTMGWCFVGLLEWTRPFKGLEC